MPRVSASHLFERGVEDSFTICTDLANCADRITAIVSVDILTEGEVGLGTRWEETRRMGKREHTGTFEISGFDPPKGYQVTTEGGGAIWVTDFTFEEAEGGTLVSMDCRWDNRGVMLRLMSPMIKRMMRKEMAKDLADLAGSIAA